LSPRVFAILKQIKQSEREVAVLLQWNNELASAESRLNTYKRHLEKQNKDLLTRTMAALSEARAQITDILRSQQSAQGKRTRILRAAKTGKGAPSQKELLYAGDTPKSVIDVIQSLDIDASNPVRILIEYIDNEFLRQKLENREYIEFLNDLTAYLEESL
jgi:hypothetical protein